MALGLLRLWVRFGFRVYRVWVFCLGFRAFGFMGLGRKTRSGGEGMPSKHVLCKDLQNLQPLKFA